MLSSNSIVNLKTCLKNFLGHAVFFMPSASGVNFINICVHETCFGAQNMVNNSKNKSCTYKTHTLGNQDDETEWCVSLTMCAVAFLLGIQSMVKSTPRGFRTKSLKMAFELSHLCFPFPLELIITNKNVNKSTENFEVKLGQVC